MKELVQSFATTMDNIQKSDQAFMLEMIKAFTDKSSSQKEWHLGNERILFEWIHKNGFWNWTFEGMIPEVVFSFEIQRSVKAEA